jgi:hypothetical protein
MLIIKFIKSESNLDSELFEVPKHIQGTGGMGQLLIFKPLFMVYILTCLLVEYMHAALAAWPSPDNLEDVCLNSGEKCSFSFK